MLVSLPLSPEQESKLSDQDLLANITYRFSLLEEAIESVFIQAINGLMIRGRGGIGKTYTVEMVADRFKGCVELRTVTGHMSPLQVYNTLYEFRESNQMVVFDDADSVFEDAKGMNILKAAMDTKSHRVVSWDSNTRLLTAPNSYEFAGRLIIITNSRLSHRDPKSGEEKFNDPHVEAFCDRILSFPLELSPREKLLRIRQVAMTGEDVDPVIGEKVMTWLMQNYSRIGDRITLRTFVKTMQLAKFSQRWRELASLMVFQNG